jgi:hypothetical protein
MVYFFLDLCPVESSQKKNAAEGTKRKFSEGGHENPQLLRGSWMAAGPRMLDESLYACENAFLLVATSVQLPAFFLLSRITPYSNKVFHNMSALYSRPKYFR